MSSGYSTCSKLFCLTHVQVKVRFPDYAFNENIHIYCISRMGCFPDTPFLRHAKIKEGDQLRGRLISLRVSLHERDRAGLIDNPALKSKVQ